MQLAKFVLASASPRRRELLALVVPEYEICAAGVDEGAVCGHTPAALVGTEARAKCAAVAALRPEAAVIGCDTVVEKDGKALGKPRDRADAEGMLRLLSGGVHAVHTGVSVAWQGAFTDFMATTQVTFAPLSPKEISDYLDTGEPYDKAGAYAVQGGAAKFVTGMNGCYFNVMGLPVAALYQTLKGLGLLPG